MTFSRERLTARHPLAVGPIRLGSSRLLDNAERLERVGNWQLAAETYSRLESAIGEAIPEETRAKILVRSATCFEISAQARPAARAYSDAARLLSSINFRPQTVGELFNRAAHQHSIAEEFFTAGSAWRAAATEFSKLGTRTVTPDDPILPVPVNAAGLTIAGMCFEAAGDSFLAARGNEVWACGAYWEAGNAYAKTFPSPNIQAFNAYRRALNATIQFYGTLAVEKLRLSLPLSESERASKLDPLKVLEDASFKCDYHHQPPMAEAERSTIARLATDRRLAAAYHEFSVLSSNIANAREAGQFRAVEKERIRRAYFAEREYGKWLLYSLWKLTSGYGESLLRWFTASIIVLSIFSALYSYFDAISPQPSNWFDYIYFSVVTFSSLGYGDFHPDRTIGKILACTEIALGLIMFGVLLSFLGNRFRQT